MGGREARLDPRHLPRRLSADTTTQLKRPEDYVNHSLYFEAKTFLHGLLVVEDKLSMAHGLETRVPFLDNDLVDFAMRCPVRSQAQKSERGHPDQRERAGGKSRAVFQKTSDGKQILRDVMRRFIPARSCEARSRGSPRPTPDGSRAKASTLYAES